MMRSRRSHRPTDRPAGGLVAASAALLAALVLPVASADWPHWRGPGRTGVAAVDDAPLTWGPADNVRWRLPLPEKSGSTPIVFGDRVYLNVADGDALELWCVDRGNGEVVWRRPLDDRNVDKRKGNMSSPSPVVDADGVWVMTGTGILAGFGADGRELWRRDLQEEYGPFGILHGYSSSPLLHGDSLYVQVLHGFLHDDPSYVLRIDKRTGETRWRVERPTDAPREAPDAYTTPALLPRADGFEIVVSGADYVTGHDPARGRELWRVPGLNPTANPAQRIVASPIVAGSMLFVPSRVDPLVALDASRTAPGEAPAVVWMTSRGPDVPTPVPAGDHLFVLTDNGIVWCLEVASGRVVWGPERVEPATYSASPVVAAGRLYVTNEAGLTTVLAAGPEFRVLAENHIEEYTLSSLAVADGQIFLRTAESLYCIDDNVG